MLHERVVKDSHIAGGLRIVRTSILSRPGLQDINDGQLSIPVAIDRRRRVNRTMKLQERIPLIPLSGGARPHTLHVGCIIPGATDSRKSRKPASYGGVAGDHAGETTAIRLARRVYSGCVDAEGFFHVREQIVGEVQVVGTRRVCIRAGEPVSILAVWVDGNSVGVEFRV